MINKTDLKTFRNGEIMKFLSNVVTILGNYELEPLASKQTALGSAYTALASAYKLERGSKITTELIELDRKRDGYYVALRIILEQHASYHPEESERTKAQDVLAVVTRHGVDLHRRSYQEQTAGVDNICGIIDGDEGLSTAVANLNVSVYYLALKGANSEFDGKYLQRNTEYARMPDTTLKELRLEAEEAFKDLVSHLNAHVILADNPAQFVSLSTEIGTLLNSYYEIVDRRLGTDMGGDVLDGGPDGEMDADDEAVPQT